MTTQDKAQVWRIFFDPKWYSTRYADAPSDPELAARHFSEHGLPLGRVPGPMFDPQWYARQYPDVVAAGMDPVQHFFSVGWREMRIPSAEADIALALVSARSTGATPDPSDPARLWQAVTDLGVVVMANRQHEFLTMDEQRWYNVTLARTEPAGDRRAHETPS